MEHAGALCNNCHHAKRHATFVSLKRPELEDSVPSLYNTSYERTVGLLKPGAGNGKGRDCKDGDINGSSVDDDDRDEMESSMISILLCYRINRTCRVHGSVIK